MAADLELVVARYREDLAWLRRVPPAIRVTVYDKGGDLPDALPLPNVGHEAHTYLQHVVSRYDSLAPLTVFCQGRPFDHVPDMQRRLKRLATGEARVAGFHWFGFVIDWDDAQGAHLFQKWSKNRDGRGLALNAFWCRLWDTPPPARHVFVPGAHFAVTAEQIRRQPHAFFERALNISVQVPDAGHCFERTWDRVFGADGIPADLRARELPVYLRPIRRLGITWADVPPEHRGW
ncbi:MAG: DUF3431 domain-containing protein [Verrucomicrobia bacterium]|nr:DUF3431 domain-containing protein [Verrucomicrobiota bacterium]